MLKPEISFADFMKVDMRVGRIDRVEPFPKARRAAYKLWIDFGGLGMKKTSAQITERYQPDELVGMLVVAVVNFPAKQIADFMSEVLVLGAVDEEGGDVILVQPNQRSPLGREIS